MSTLMVGNAFSVGPAHENRAFWAEHDLLERVEEVLVTDLLLLTASSPQCGLIDQIFQVCPRGPRRHCGKISEYCVVRQRHVAGVDFEDCFPPGPIREIHDNA